MDRSRISLWRPAASHLATTILAGALLAATVVVALPVPAHAAARPVPDPLTVVVTDQGFVPSTANLAVGQTLWVDNHTADPQSVTATDGWVDSGPIPPNGRFVMTATALGSHTFSSTTSPTFTGTIVVGALELTGSPTELAGPHVPNRTPPLSSTVDVHPTWGVYASRDRAIVRFTDTATVAQANAALAEADVTIVGGWTKLDEVAVSVVDSGVPGDFGRLTAALTKLRANPAVRAAAMDMATNPDGEVAREIARPSAPDPAAGLDPPGPTDDAWTWQRQFTDIGTPSGSGGNWGLEASRFPDAWNLIEPLTLRPPTTPVDTVVFDTGFDMSHPDFAGATLDELCTQDNVCATNDPTAHHGTATASIIGAAWNRTGSSPSRSAGIQGANPLVRLHTVAHMGVSKKWNNTWTIVSSVTQGEMIVDNMSARFPHLRVINGSFTNVVFSSDKSSGNATWTKDFAGKRCGPGEDDDSTAAATEQCLPHNEDSFLHEMNQLAEAFRPFADQLAARNILWVQSAGNFSGKDYIPRFCVENSTPCVANEIKGYGVNAAALLERHWGPGTPPILTVEAYNVRDHNHAWRDQYSNVAGDVAAPGLYTLAANAGGGYQEFSGTSAAAPFVTALAGFVSTVNPSLPYDQVRKLIIGNARRDVLDGDTTAPTPLDAPRIDAYASVMATPGAAALMVDVNDPSADGNRRTVRDDGNNIVAADPIMTNSGPWHSQPDGNVDMRDFRRYRDAYLQSCQAVGSTCAFLADVNLDGGPSAAKRDLNFDGCLVYLDPKCPPDEITLQPDGSVVGAFSRLDFNGDGFVSPVAAPVPLNADGTPTTDGSTHDMTDLEVLQSQWGKGPNPDLQGWKAADLKDLMRSADLTIRTDKLFDGGATAVDIQPLTGVGGTPTQPVSTTKRGDVVVTVPIDAHPPTNDDIVQARVQIHAPDHDTTSVSPAMALKRGDDHLFTPCASQLGLTTDHATIAPGGTPAQLDLSYNDCSSPSVGLPVAFEIVGDGHGAQLSTPAGVTDATGHFRVTLSAGSSGQVVVRAHLSVAPGGEDLTRDLTITVAPPVRVYYKWRQTTLDYQRHASNDWGSGQDDCDGPVDSAVPANEGCFSSDTSFDHQQYPADEVYTLERQGSITPDVPNTVRVTEKGRMGATGTWSLDSVPIDTKGQVSPANDPTHPTATDSTQLFTLPNADTSDASWAHQFNGTAVSNMNLEFVGNHLNVTGLDHLADLAYPLTSTRHGSAHRDDLDMAPADLLLVPRADHSQLTWSNNPAAALSISPQPGGGFAPYTYCGVVDRDFASIPKGYWNDSDPVGSWGYRDMDARDPSRQPGDRAAPIYTGEFRARMEFVAVATIDGHVPGDAELAFPTCTKTDPDLAILADVPSPEEGKVVTFYAQISAVSPGDTYQWDFGDGTTSTGPNPTHVFADNGTYTVKLTRFSPSGTQQTTLDVTVTNAAPTIGTATSGSTTPSVTVPVDDQGPIDRMALKVSVSSSNPAFKPPAPSLAPAGTPTIPLGAQSPGVYLLKVTVRDKDGAEASTYTTLVVPPSLDLLTNAKSARAADASRAAVTASASPNVPSGIDPTPVPAFVIGGLSLATGQGVSVHNVSRAGGQPVVATLDAGDGRPTVPVAADATVVIGYLEPGTPTIKLTTGPASARVSTATSITTAGSAIAATLGYEGATSGAQGQVVTVAARVTSGPNVGVAGRTVQFTLDGATATGVTGSDGLATSSLSISSPSGSRSLVVDVPAPANGAALSTTVPFVVIANSTPSVSAGGPYFVAIGGDLALAGTGSDPDPTDSTDLVYAWDLDADGQFDDADGASAAVSWADVQAVVCGGTCDPGVAHPIALQVTDSRGARATASTSVSARRDFALSVSPGSATLVPSSSTSFAVSVTTASGFDQPVTLTAPGLPTGVTAQFAPAVVVPGSLSVLTISAGPSISAQSFSLSVVGTSGAISHQAGGTVDLEFGLVPVCYGTFDVAVTNADTGGPLGGAHVSSSALPDTITDASGHVRFDQVPLSSDNRPVSFGLTARVTNFDVGFVNALAACNVVTPVAIAVSPFHFGSITGHARQTGIDGAPSATPFPGVDVAAFTAAGQQRATTATDGGYAIPDIRLNNSPNPTSIGVRATAPGYHPQTATVPVVNGAPAVQDFMMVKMCTAAILVRVLDGNLGHPVPNASVSTDRVTDTGRGQTVLGHTDGGGRFQLDDLPTDPGGQPRTYQVVVSAPAGAPFVASVFVPVTVPACGVTVPIDVGLTIPHENRGVLDASVVDDETGAPIAGATVFDRQGNIFVPAPALTDAGGHVSWDLLLGYDDVTTKSLNLTASAAGYWAPPSTQNVTVSAGQHAPVVVRLLRKKEAAAEGTVRDRATAQPLANVAVTALGSSDTAITDASGHYRLEHLPLGQLNQPTSTWLTANQTSTHWGSTIPVTISPGVNAFDLTMNQICGGATVRGVVVNAITHEPIEGANVSTPTFSGFPDNVASTGPDGRFVLPHVIAGADNVPRQVDISASKPGFISATKTVTIFCGADVVVDFGRAASATGTIVGHVSDQSGGSVGDTFIGSGFGGSAMTDASGDYTITDAPVSEDGSPRSWTLTAVPPEASGLGPVSGDVTAIAGHAVRRDFVLGATGPTTTTTSPSSTTTSTASTSTTATTSTTSTTEPATTSTTTSTTSTTSTSTTSTSSTSTSTSTTTAPSTTSSSTSTTSTSTTMAPTTTVATTTPSAPSTTAPRTPSTTVASSSSTSSTSTTTDPTSTPSTSAPSTTGQAVVAPDSLVRASADASSGPDVASEDPGGATASTTSQGTLPATGSPIGLLTLLGSSLVLLGASAVTMARRSRARSSTDA